MKIINNVSGARQLSHRSQNCLLSSSVIRQQSDQHFASMLGVLIIRKRELGRQKSNPIADSAIATEQAQSQNEIDAWEIATSVVWTMQRKTIGTEIPAMIRTS